jgi:hypothetical protein
VDSRFRGNDKRGLNSMARSFAGAQDDKRGDELMGICVDALMRICVDPCLRHAGTGKLRKDKLWV